MKITGILMCILVLFSGCTKRNSGIDRAMQLRNALLSATETELRVNVVADYGKELHSFTMDCVGNEQGDIQFSVLQPETISGIAGSVSDEGGKLTFDDELLYIGLLADGQLSPVTAPWIFLRSLRGGYIRSAGMEEDLLRVTVDDSFAEKPLSVDIWLDKNNDPVCADILFDGRRILSLGVESFYIR